MTVLAPVGFPGKLGQQGLTLILGLSYEQWAEVGWVLWQLHAGLQFAFADWVCYGETAYSERFSQAVGELNIAPQTLLNWLSVSRAFPIERRRDAPLTFSHHAAVAALDPEAQDRWLDAAEHGAWSVTRLRAEVRASGVRRAVALPTPVENPASDALVPGCLLSIHGIGACRITAIMGAQHGVRPEVGADVVIYCERVP